MPIVFTTDPKRRLVETKATGVLGNDEFAAHVRALAARDLLAFPQLIDAREASVETTPADAREFAKLTGRLRAAHGSAKVAFVTSSDATYGILRVYTVVSEEVDPGFRVFRDIDQAREWLQSSE